MVPEIIKTQETFFVFWCKKQGFRWRSCKKAARDVLRRALDEAAIGNRAEAQKELSKREVQAAFQVPDAFDANKRAPAVTPIQDILHRIQWDTDFGKGSFMIGYYDRAARKILRVPFRKVHLARGQHFSFDVEAEDGTSHMVPFHRVREVWRNSELIWQRLVQDDVLP